NNRGAAESQKGDFTRAAADLDTAVRLGPNSQEAIGNRGFLRLAMGDFTGAAADFTKLAQAGPSDPYRILWRHIARLRAGEPDDGFVREASGLGEGEWPGAPLPLFLGQLARES